MEEEVGAVITMILRYSQNSWHVPELTYQEQKQVADVLADLDRVCDINFGTCIHGECIRDALGDWISYYGFHGATRESVLKVWKER